MKTPTPQVTLDPAEYSEKPILRNLLELYLYDFTEFTGDDIGADAHFGYRYLDHYWTDPDRYPFLIRASGALAGFALVRGSAPRDMSEFFVMRKFRRQGVGATAAKLVFQRFPGPWQVRELAANLPAQAFWRRTIRDYAGAFEEHSEDGEVTQRFATQH
jgi:predicted acetyltransferase